MRSEKLREEMKTLQGLPGRRLEDYTEVRGIRVTKFSTISVRKNVYSVHSRLIDSLVNVRVYSDILEVWYAGKCVASMPRLRGKAGHAINYRHIIDSLVKKPGAFANYKYRSDLFPQFIFKLAYDSLCGTELKADAIYVQILYLAAKEGEDRVDRALRYLVKNGAPLTLENVTEKTKENIPQEGIAICEMVVNLVAYDSLLEAEHVSC